MRVFPFPEISNSLERAGGWAVKHGTGSTALLSTPKGRIMNVPLGRRAHARAVRLHELLHKEFSPFSDGPELASIKADPMIVQAVEDLRLHYKAIHQLDLREEITPVAELHDIARIVDYKPKNSAFLGMLSVAPMEGVVEMADQYYTIRAEAAADEGAPQSAARFELFRQILPECLTFTAEYYRATEGSDDPLPFEFTKFLAEALQVLLGGEKVSVDKQKTQEGLPDGYRWAPMKVVEPPLPIFRRAPTVCRRRYSARDVGVIVRNPGRYALDRAVFSRSKRIKERGGTILVDISASMEFAPKDVDEIIRASPAATVATYCADLGGEINPESLKAPWGELAIVALNKRRVETIHRMGTHNLIDGPALDWLARQEAPRYWVSDGLVTCLNNEHNARVKLPAARSYCKEVCRVNSIERVRNIDELIPALLKEKEVKR